MEHPSVVGTGRTQRMLQNVLNCLSTSVIVVGHDTAFAGELSRRLMGMDPSLKRGTYGSTLRRALHGDVQTIYFIPMGVYLKHKEEYLTRPEVTVFVDHYHGAFA